jgi:hypothetical protein
MSVLPTTFLLNETIINPIAGADALRNLLGRGG